ncbi:uncharacterized protein PV09_02299 [Verruconis gallopava]|uniref:Pentatricopeptide repeat domain-containing protein n=1 Tax=Verruconis gallopava TaxID=253628 RepID=A0A0D2AJ66_9PEZI|nr:uncharacterized protein PV09_02299 [Verruconis gallopava]KIW06580.1 hypothetical protein PV09_02299 [Verruconis gallopava]
MRNLWLRIRPFGCCCHCYSCIENRHVQVRRLSVAIARFRCGRGFPPLLNDSFWTSSRETLVMRQRQRFQSGGAVKKEKCHDQEQVFENKEPLFQAGSGNGLPTSVSSKAADHIRREEGGQSDTEKREKKLKEAANDLRSLSIDHWSLEDVVTYEPMPGGATPPTVPSTTKADPKYMMPQSPWAPDHLKRQNYARVWTRKKIAKMETAIALFTVRVCRLLELNSQRPSNLIVLPEAIRPFARLPAEDHEYMEQALKRHLGILRNKLGFVAPHDPPHAPEEIDVFIPKYEHFEDGLHHELLRDLNASLVELFEGYKYLHLDFRTLMVKICHNLLVSSAPPNVQTMNILLLGFYSCDRYLTLSTSHVRHLVLDWLIDICRTVMIRPNEITCSTILATYRKRGMRDAFVDFIFLMRGMGGDRALMYTKDLTITRESAPRLSPTKTSPTVFKQAVYPSPMIFAEVIKGVAKFYTLEDAVAVCKEFTAKEWGYDWRCLHYLLNACIIAKDWQSGLWVWDEIKAFRAAGYEEPVRILAAMLALCVQCEQEQMFNDVLEYSAKQLRNISKAAFVDIATEILERAVDKMNDDELAALESRFTKGKSVERLHEQRAFEASIRRRLKDDPVFKRAVFGFGYDVLSEEHRRKKPQRESEHNPQGIGRKLDEQQKIVDVEDMNEVLLAEEENDVTRPGKDTKHNLLQDAEGGIDVDEDNTNSPSSPDRGKGHEQ